MSAIKQARERLLHEQHTGVGGSEVHHIFNLAPYGCARQLAYTKRGQPPDHPFHGNNATERGQKLEDFGAQVYAEATGRQIRRVAGGLTGVAKRDKQFPFMLVHADREILNDPRGPGMLSVKVPGREMYQKVKWDGMPASWPLQLQYEMSIFNRSWGDFAIFWPDGWEILPSTDVDLDTGLVKEVREGVRQFWFDYVEPADAPLPPKLDAKDSRCARCPFRTTCQGDAMLAGAKDPDQPDIPYDSSLAELVQLRFEQQDIVDQATALLEETNNKIKEAMGDRGAVETAGARIYYRPQPGRETFQAKAFLKAHPDLREDMSKFTNVGAPFRSLRVYPR